MSQDGAARLVDLQLGDIAVALGGLTGIVIVDALTSSPWPCSSRGSGSPHADRAAGVDRAAEPRAAASPGLVAEWVNRAADDRGLDRPPEHDHDRGREPGRTGHVRRPVRRVGVLDQLAADGGAVGLIRVQAIGGVIGGIVIGVLGPRIGARPMIGWGFIAFGLISLVTLTISRP